MTLDGWQRLWTVALAAWTVVVILFVSSDWTDPWRVVSSQPLPNDPVARSVSAAPVAARVDDNGAPLARVVDKNTGLRAYLHEIPTPWYKADQAASQKRPAEIEAQIRAGNAPAPTGQNAGVNRQSFYGGIQIGRKPTG